MTMKYIMIIGGVIYIKEKGYVISGTVKEERIKSNPIYIGERNALIYVESGNFNYKFKL